MTKNNKTTRQTAVMVIGMNGTRLMPTIRFGKVRHLLKNGMAEIAGRHPFTIRLRYETTEFTQPVEVCMDTGYLHAGISVKSEKREYVSAQYDLLENEKERRDDARKYRRTRRNRKRYRAPRFDNRRKKEGWFAPSIENKADRQTDTVIRYCKAAPVTGITVETGPFDTQLLQALEEGEPVPEGCGYQHGARYGIETLRQAVFERDRHTCVFCGRSIKDGAILHAHHIYFWRGQHGNRLEELASCCEKCHTAKNHKPGGLLWGVDRKMGRFSGAAFMNAVRWQIYERLKDTAYRVSITYGARTKTTRMELGIEKSHANDAYAMGTYHPKERSETVLYKKRRRNNRSLEKFYDAKYIDGRDGTKKSGSQLSCVRTNRRESRRTEKNERNWRGRKVSKGRRTIRKTRYRIQPGTIILYENKKYRSKGVQHYGEYVTAEGLEKAVPAKKVTIVSQPSGWYRQPLLSSVI